MTELEALFTSIVDWLFKPVEYIMRKTYKMPSTDNTITELPVVPVKAPVVPESAPTAAFKPMIVKWAAAITQWEGAAPESHNGGNLKYSSLTASWGATKGRAASDGGFLCQFATPELGQTALCNFLTLGCEDELVAFHSPTARTLEGFTKIYAGNPPQGYINGIVAALAVSPQVQISTFLAS